MNQQTRDDPVLVMCCNYFVASDSEDDSKTVEEFDGFIHCLRLKYKKENIVKAYTANNSMYRYYLFYTLILARQINVTLQ